MAETYYQKEDDLPVNANVEVGNWMVQATQLADADNQAQANLDNAGNALGETTSDPKAVECRNVSARNGLNKVSSAGGPRSSPGSPPESCVPQGQGDRNRRRIFGKIVAP